MKYWIILVLCILFITIPSNLFAQSYSYDIENFQSRIELEKNTRLTITETIFVNFLSPKHGIYRIIPSQYTHKGKTINSHLTVISIRNEKGSDINYETSRFKQSIKIKIGDPGKTVSGPQTYIVRYKVDGLINLYDGEPEIYWNVTGSEWDTTINKSRAQVISNFADITSVDCFSGDVGSGSKNCTAKFEKTKSEFEIDNRISPGQDFTIVVGLNKENNLIYPGASEKITRYVLDNWGYIISILPFLLILFFWYQRGRDTRFVSDNVYFRPDDRKERRTSVFERKLLPLVYHPIDGLTPAEIGTIMDEKVDIQDIVAEIVELARLGFIKIEKINKKGFLKKPEYGFEKLENNKKSEVSLKAHQKLILDELFGDSITKASIKKTSGILDENEHKRVEDLMGEGKYILLGGLKTNFYSSLADIKRKLYTNLTSEGLFNENPDKVRGKWIAISILFETIAFLILIYFHNLTANFGPFIILIVFMIPVIYLSLAMPRRTSWGRSLYMQSLGLKNYLSLGKWREEINEKHLFLEEMLPLAVALGVVEKLTSDMKELGIAPPKYFEGTSSSRFASDFSAFSAYSVSSLISTPQGVSGGSSWSGGSGFGGGSSGGGFGGGGGGSW